MFARAEGKGCLRQLVVPGDSRTTAAQAPLGLEGLKGRTL